ncbi:MAG: hypothetical protein MJZ38_05985 [archaeon]|nr:hypothetical protein [archaeon]
MKSDSEKTLVDVAYGAAVSAQYESGRSFDENRKALDDIISQCKQELTKFRDDTDSFEIYKRVKMRYIETQDTFGSEEVVQLIRTYSDRVKALNFSDRRDLAGNLARVDEVVASFDSEVAKVGASRFGAFKVTILAELNSMMASYEAPEVKALISDSIFEVENYYYDSGVSYGSNTNRLNDILGTLRGEIEIMMSGLLENFEKYCREYLDLFADRRTDPMYSAKDYQDAFDTAISGISALRYDRSLNLKGNEVRADDIATTLHESVYLISSEHVKAEFARYRGEALDYVSHKVVSGATDAINSLADEIKGRIKAVEYDPALSAEENDAAVRVLVEEFETRLAPLVQHADFDRVVDAGVDYLIERYGAYEVLSAELTADILALRAVAYDDAMTLEDNQKVIETMVNGFSVELFKQRQKSARGDYDNYRDYLIYEIDRTLPANAPQELVTLAREHTDRIKAADFDETSYLYNKSVVHRIYLDYLDRAVPVLIRVHKDVIVSGLKALADGSRSVDDAIARGESSVRGYVPLNDLDQDLSRLDTLKELAELGIGYAKARSDESVFSSFVDVRVSVIRGLPCIGERAVALRDSTLADIAGIMSSGRSLADRAKAVEDADLGFLTRHTFLCAAASASEEIHREHIFGESPAAAALIDRYADMVANLPYDEGWSVFGGTDRIVALLDEFQGALFQRRVLDNSTVSGELNADGTSSVTGGVAEYPEGSDEIWGIVGNAKGMGGSSSVVFRKVDVPVDPYSGRMMPAEGSTIAALSDGKVLGAFEIDIYNGGQKVSAFSGSYVVKILLPAEMRGYRTMQVAYVDEFGDVQVYDAEVEGNFLVFATTHFSVFSVIGVNPEVARYYDAYVFAIAVVFVVAFLLYMSRVVVFVPEDGRKAYAYSFGAPEGEIVNPFAGDGRRLVGWRREGTEELIPADADASVLGGSRIIRISPVWEEENEGGKA